MNAAFTSELSAIHHALQWILLPSSQGSSDRRNLNYNSDSEHYLRHFADIAVKDRWNKESYVGSDVF